MKKLIFIGSLLFLISCSQDSSELEKENENISNYSKEKSIQLFKEFANEEVGKQAVTMIDMLNLGLTTPEAQMNYILKKAAKDSGNTANAH